MKPIFLSFSEILDSIPFASIKGYFPDIVIGIERGGVVLASLVAFRLGIELRSIRASLYDDSKPAKKKFDEPKIEMHNLNGMEGKRVLIVDDVSNSGATLDAVKSAIASIGAKEIKTFVYAGKADFSCRPFERCLVFPWEERK